MVKQIVDSITEGFLARGHSYQMGGKGHLFIDYARGYFDILAGDLSLLGYGISLVKQAEQTGFIREIVGEWAPVAPIRAALFEADPYDLFRKGLNAVVLKEGGLALQEQGVKVILRPPQSGPDPIESPHPLWVKSQIDDPRFPLDDLLTRKEMVVQEMKRWGECIFSPPEELGDYCDLAPKGITLALTEVSAPYLRRRLTPSYTPLCVSLQDLPLFKEHTIQMVTLTDFDEDVSLLFSKS